MGSRLTESVKLIEKGYRRKMKKERWEKTTPSFRNFEIDISYKRKYREIDLTITDILDIEDKRIIKSKIASIEQYGSNYLITAIDCPACGNQIKLNKHWNCFICECKEHPKKSFEISSISYPAPRHIKELPSNDYE